MEKRKLVRSDSERMIAGVCGGIAEYLDIDPTLVRLAFVGLILAGLHGLWIYLILMLLMPPAYRAAAPQNPASVEVVDVPPQQD
jgi:phage shock protein PspC (stress-responsive transcriptional regulator)